MAVTFRFAVPGEYSKISKFLNEFWARDHIYCRNEKLFEWTFNRPTHWQPGEYSFAVAEEDGELVGILGGIPFTFNHFGKESRGVWIVNYVIGPDHRKGPVALKLLSTFRRPDIDPVIAFGITQATTVIYKVLRGRVLPPIPRSFLLLPEGKERFGRLLKIVYPDWSDDRTASLASAFSKEIEQGQTVSAGEGIPATWDETDWPTIAQTTVGAVRNSDYLTWRYRDHPVFEYRFLSIPEGNRHGLLVWRLETIRKQTDNGREDLDRIGRLVEFLPASEANAAQLLGAFVKELRKHDAVGADFYGFHGQTRQYLANGGFVPTEIHPDGKAIPSRFQPLDGKGGDILSAMFVGASLPDCNTAADCPWYWTKSDSDQDRPN